MRGLQQECVPGFQRRGFAVNSALNSVPGDVGRSAKQQGRMSMSTRFRCLQVAESPLCSVAIRAIIRVHAGSPRSLIYSDAPRRPGSLALLIEIVHHLKTAG